jgi:hypothetical protein
MPIAGGVLQRGRLRLDGDAALALDIHRVEHLGFHLAVRQSTATLDDAISECRLAVVDMGNDGEVADVVHAGLADVACAIGRGGSSRFQRVPPVRREVSADVSARELKKRHVQEETRLPTKRMATACWAFIVAKTTRLEPAPLLVFRPLRGANRT